MVCPSLSPYLVDDDGLFCLFGNSNSEPLGFLALAGPSDGDCWAERKEGHVSEELQKRASEKECCATGIRVAFSLFFFLGRERERERERVGETRQTIKLTWDDRVARDVDLRVR